MNGREVLAAIADDLARRLREFVVAPHRPVNVGTGREPHAYCVTCRADWPCPRFIELVPEPK